MTTTLGYSRDIPHEREYIDDVHIEVLKHQTGITFGDLLKGRNLVSVRASMDTLLKEGKIRVEIEPGHNNLYEAERIIPDHTSWSDAGRANRAGRARPR
jgi:hypothetical protein